MPRTSAIDRGGDALPRTLGDRYRLDSKVGEGGMGVVYSATHLASGKVVAVKLLKAEYSAATEHAERFLREARAVAHVSHPNVVSILDLGQDPGTDALYFVMELVPGLSLAQLLQKERRLHPRRVVGIMRQVCAGLGAAHAAGIVHRDLKVSNVLLTRVGDQGDFVKVFDFGVAKFADEAEANLTHSGMMVGTLECMSPEQILGEAIDARTDIYALGATAYRALTGTPVFSAAGVAALVHKHLNVPPDPPTVRMPDGSIPPALEAVVLRCLAKHPDDRFSSMAEVSEALAEAVEGTDSGMLTLDLERTPGPGSVELPEPFVPTPAPVRGTRELETSLSRAPPASWSRGDDPRARTINIGVSSGPASLAELIEAKPETITTGAALRPGAPVPGAALRPEDFAAPSPQLPAPQALAPDAPAAELPWPSEAEREPATFIAGTPLPPDGRSTLLLVVLAVVCGLALAVGVYQLSRSLGGRGSGVSSSRPAEPGAAAAGAEGAAPGERAAAAAAPGSIVVASSVAGAEVFINGLTAGAAPAVLRPEDFDPLQLRVTAPGYEPLEVVLTPTSAEQTFEARLTPSAKAQSDKAAGRKPRK